MILYTSSNNMKFYKLEVEKEELISYKEKLLIEKNKKDELFCNLVTFSKNIVDKIYGHNDIEQKLEAFYILKSYLSKNEKNKIIEDYINGNINLQLISRIYRNSRLKDNRRIYTNNILFTPKTCTYEYDEVQKVNLYNRDIYYKYSINNLINLPNKLIYLHYLESGIDIQVQCINELLELFKIEEINKTEYDNHKQLKLK